MSSREILQVFGTNIMRAFFDDKVWVNGTLSLDNGKILELNPMRLKFKAL
jgi:hypothetical protein